MRQNYPMKILQGFLLIFVVLAAVLGSIVSRTQATPDTHTRALHLTWSRQSATEAKFTLTGGFRRSGYPGSAPDGYPAVGDIILETIGGTGIFFGDGTSTGTLYFLVTSIDPSGDWIYAVALNPNNQSQNYIPHIYPSSGTFTAYVDSCCRISPPSHINNPDGYYRVEAMVNLNNVGNPASGLPPIVDCLKDTICTFVIPGSDPDGRNVRFRMSTSSEAAGFGTFIQPGPPFAPHAASVAVNGIYTWDTIGATLNSTGTTLYSTQVTLEDYSNGNLTDKSAYDFFIRIVDSPGTNLPPVFDSPPSPANGLAFEREVGQDLIFTIQASDPDTGDLVVLNALNLPPGSQFAPAPPSNPASASFSWKPTSNDTGTHIVTFNATDSQATAAQPLVISIEVRENLPAVVILVHGWMGLDRTGDTCTPSSSPLGPWQSGGIGWGQNPPGSVGGYFRSLPEWLTEQEYKVYQVRLTTNLFDTPTFEANAACITPQIDQIIAANGGRPVILVAHSMGGLVGRSYIHSLGNTAREKVEQLYTFGSPHGGINYVNSLIQVLAKQLGIATSAFCLFIQPGTCEFATTYMKWFYNPLTPNDGNVQYTFVAGDASSLDDWSPLPPAIWTTDGINDGTIGRHSASGNYYEHLCLFDCVTDTGIGDFTAYWTGDSHAVIVGHPTYFELNIGNTGIPQSTECLLSWLAGEDDCSNLIPSLADPLKNPSASSNVIADFRRGIIAAGDLISVTVPVDTDDQAVMQLSWLDADLEFTLVQPDGQLIDPEYAANNPNLVTYGTTPKSFESPGIDTYLFPNIMSGPWIIYIQNNGIDSTAFTLQTILESTLLLEFDISPKLYKPGENLMVSASLESDGTGLSGANVELSLVRSDAVTDTVVLVDQGGGLYAGHYLVPAAPGHLLANLNASGVSTQAGSGSLFAREAFELLGISPQTVSLTGNYNDYALDDDGNGLSEALVVDVELDVDASGDILVFGTLQANSERITSAVQEATLTAGTANVSLEFDGDEIRLAEFNGPYTLTRLAVIEQVYGGIPSVVEFEAFVTGAYNWNSFGSSCFTLEIAASPAIGGTIATSPSPNCNIGVGNAYAIGTTVTLTAIANPGYQFTGWSGDVSGSAPSAIIQLDQYTQVTANFLRTNVYLPITVKSVVPVNNPPYTPSDESPSHGAAGQAINVNLSWTGGDYDGDEVRYDVYLEAGDASPDALACDDVTVPVCDPGTLSYETIYYWQVIATDEHGATAASPVWNFTTGSASASCTNLVLNSGFEFNGDWERPITEMRAEYTNEQAHSGLRSMKMGITDPLDNVYSYSSARQIVAIPADPISVTLEFWLYPMSTETANLSFSLDPLNIDILEASSSSDSQMVLILDPVTEDILGTLQMMRSDAQEWVEYAFDLIEYSGSSVKLYFGTFNNGIGGVTSMYVDDVFVEVCPE